MHIEHIDVLNERLEDSLYDITVTKGGIQAQGFDRIDTFCSLRNYPT